MFGSFCLVPGVGWDDDSVRHSVESISATAAASDVAARGKHDVPSGGPGFLRAVTGPTQGLGTGSASTSGSSFLFVT